MARYATFCLIMGPFKEEVPVFARLWPVLVRVMVRFTTGAVRSAILATAGLLVFFNHILFLELLNYWYCRLCRLTSGKVMKHPLC